MALLADFIERFSFIEEASCIEKEKFIKALGKPAHLKAFVQTLQDHAAEGCYGCESEGRCLLFLGIAFLELGQRKEAKLRIEEAIRCFGNCCDLWNQINGLNLLGWIHEKEGNYHRALHNYREALRLLKGTYHSLNSYEYNSASTDLKTEIEQSISRVQNGSSPADKASHRLRLRWLPVYAKAQATPRGPIWTDEAGGQNCIEAETLIINDNTYTLYSCIPGENSVSLRADRRYGWVEVHGDSMNAATPVPFEETDFALFYQADDAQDGEIVIAVRAEPNAAGYEHFIKKFDKRNKQLISQTKASGGYPPINLSKDCKIMGVVIAVAKPTNRKIS